MLKLNSYRETLFEIKDGKIITRAQLQTLAGESTIAIEVINGWVNVLNEEEKYRSPNSPRRLFLSTDVAVKILYTK